MSQGPSEKAKALIDDSLRRVFQEHLEQELPDKFIALIDKLKAGKHPDQGVPE